MTQISVTNNYASPQKRCLTYLSSFTWCILHHCRGKMPGTVNLEGLKAFLLSARISSNEKRAEIHPNQSFFGSRPEAFTLARPWVYVPAPMAIKIDPQIWLMGSAFWVCKKPPMVAAKDNQNSERFQNIFTPRSMSRIFHIRRPRTQGCHRLKFRA